MIDQKYLLHSAQTGNAEAFGFLYEEYRNELYLYAYKFLGNREDAEDAVQQASVNVYVGINNIKNPESFKAYYFKALANTARSMLSMRKFHVVDVEQYENVASELETESASLDSIEIDKALGVLNENEREIVLLSVVAGFNSKEIAKITSFTSGSVRSKLSRALKKMKNKLEE